MNRLLSTEDAYRAMLEFLAAYYRRGSLGEIGVLLGSLDLQPDGRPADPAMEKDWSSAVASVMRKERMPEHFNATWSVVDRELLDGLWFSYQHIPGVAFSLNDFVQITNGAHENERGSTMSILDVKPEPLFLVELESGLDVHVPQSALRAADRSGR